MMAQVVKLEGVADMMAEHTLVLHNKGGDAGLQSYKLILCDLCFVVVAPAQHV